MFMKMLPHGSVTFWFEMNKISNLEKSCLTPALPVITYLIII